MRWRSWVQTMAKSWKLSTLLGAVLLSCLPSRATAQLSPCGDPAFRVVQARIDQGLGEAARLGISYDTNGTRDHRVSMFSPVGEWWYSGACHELPYNRYGNQCIMGQTNGRAISDSFTVERHFEFWDAVAVWKWFERGRNARNQPLQYVASGLSAIYANAAVNWGVVTSRGGGVPGLNEFAMYGFGATPYTQAQCEGGVPPVATPTPGVNPTPPPTPTPTPGQCSNTSYQWLPDGRCVGLPCGTIVDTAFCQGTNPTPTRTPVPPTPTPTPVVPPPAGSKCYRLTEIPCPN